MLTSGALLVPVMFAVQSFRPQDSTLAVTMLRFVARRLLEPVDGAAAALDRDRRNHTIACVRRHSRTGAECLQCACV
jgi:hypothetical protein